MGFNDYIRLLRKWAWLFLLLGLVAGSASYLVRSQQPPVYEAQVMLSVGSYFRSPDPDTAEIRTSVELARSYAVLATTHSVLQAVLEEGEFPLTQRQLFGMVSTRIVPDTSLLVLTITYTDPVMAAEIADELARQLILNSPTSLTPEQLEQVSMLTAEIATLNAELRETREQRSNIYRQLERVENPAEEERLLERRNALSNEINQISSNLAQFSATLADLQRRTNSLDVVEPAQVPTEPTGPGVGIVTALGFSVGIALAGFAVWLIEIWGDAIETPEQAAQALGHPVLAAISRFGKSGEAYSDRLVTVKDPRSPVSEQYRMLRTSLLYATGNHGKKAYIITSPGPTEGKSVTAANLAVAMADAGLRVLLVDADLRRPKLHEIFGASNDAGLTKLLYSNPREVRVRGKDWNRLVISFMPNSQTGRQNPAHNGTGVEFLQHTTVPGLRLITSGVIPPKPTDVLGSPVMKKWFRSFMSADNIDVILFDTPPTLTVSDCSILASVTGASVVVVLRAGSPRRYAAQVREQLSQLDINIEGVVFNLVSPADLGQKYYAYK